MFHKEIEQRKSIVWTIFILLLSAIWAKIRITWDFSPAISTIHYTFSIKNIEIYTCTMV